MRLGMVTFLGAPKTRDCVSERRADLAGKRSVHLCLAGLIGPRVLFEIVAVGRTL
jgi:hypothetical protein